LALAEEILVTKLFGSINGREEIRGINLRQWQSPGRIDTAIPITVKEELPGAKIHDQKRLPFQTPVTGHVERRRGVSSLWSLGVVETFDQATGREHAWVAAQEKRVQVWHELSPLTT
jgi:hypothetical protein